MFDEIQDSRGRKIFNILVGDVKRNSTEKPMVIFSGQIPDKKVETLMPIVHGILDSLLRYSFNINNFKVLISDGASECQAIGKKLKEKYKKLLHIICLCHNMHNFTEFIRKKHDLVDDVIAWLKTKFTKNVQKQVKWVHQTRLHVPKFPIITRWGTWLQFAFFMVDNFSPIWEFLVSEKFFEENSMEHKEMKEYLYDSLVEIASYWFVPEFISHLEKIR